MKARPELVVVVVAAVAGLVLGATASPALPLAPTNLLVDGSDSGLLDPAPRERAPRLTWAAAHTQRGAWQTAFRVRAYLAGDTAPWWDSGVVNASLPRVDLFAGKRLPAATALAVTVQWWDHGGRASPESQPLRVATGPSADQWANSSWIGGDFGLVRGEVRLPAAPSSAFVYVAAPAWFQLFLNGERVDGNAVNGAWTTFNKRVLYWGFNVSDKLLGGANAVGLMLGRGWRDTTAFPPLQDSSPCDALERLVRVVVVADGRVVLGSGERWGWNGTAQSPVVADSVYDGETYNATLEQPGWASAAFAPPAGSGWAPARNVTCFDPVLSPNPMPTIAVLRTNAAKSVHKLAPACPSPTTLGGTVEENDVLQLACAAGTGVISRVDFASFGTPSGSCGAFAANASCDAGAAAAAVVAKLCLNKASCSIPATNDAFGGDPCFGTPKRLSVQASGCTSADANRFVVDFGENLSGWTRIRVNVPRGTEITLRHAEVLQHPPYGPVDGSVYVGNLRSAKATDRFVAKGGGQDETFEPHFTYHGFQFVEVSGLPEGTVLGADAVQQVHFRTANPRRATFASSSQVLTDIQDRAQTGQGSNMMSVPTDCDQRDERLGWMGDAGLSADTMLLNFACEAFEDNTLRNMVDAQRGDGALPDVVPYMRYGGDPGDPSWSAAFPQLLYARFKWTGDIAPAGTYWDELGLYLANVAAQVKAAGSFAKWPAPYGDWVPADGSAKPSNSYCGAFNYITNVQQAVELATALNKSANATALQQLEAQLVEQFTAEFFDNSTLCFAGNCGQTSLALALALGAVPPSALSQVVAALVKDISTTHSLHVSVGIIGAKALFPTLDAVGQHDLAVALAEQTSQPSWGYMLYNDVEPATASVWELWDSPTQGPGMNSRNHHMFSSISQWIVQAVGGVSATASGAACVAGVAASSPSSLALAPARMLAVSRASTVVRSPCGAVSLAYQRMGGTQCAVAPEGRSLARPLAPVVPPVELDCGAHGGVISSVEFASWGRPSGMCGAFVENATACAAPLARRVVEGLCLRRVACRVPSDADFWAQHGWPTPGSGALATGGPACANSRDPRRLHVQVSCSGAHAVRSDVVVPVGVRASLALPAYGADLATLRVVDADTDATLWDGAGGVRATVVRGVPGVLSVVPEGERAVVVDVVGGTFHLELRSSD